MGSEIQFGEIEKSRPERQTPPDKNRQFAVVECQEPQSGELRIYVDLDVMKDMESHAESDTTVELGGVLLGRQLEDEQGQPFVVVSDSLRAQHYEATKGSFKFTHETWQQISRQREDLPPDLQMVGWYHTHPDWGVFLSGMDLFICENFFNNALDLALVIDPCRGDRGWFQWVEDRDQPKRTGGFYLTSSRHREDALRQYAQSLNGASSMGHDPRPAVVAGQIQPAPMYMSPAPPRSPWLELGVFGLVGVQCLMLCSLAWQSFMFASQANDGSVKPASDLAQQQPGDRQRLYEAEALVAVQRQVLQDMVAAVGGDVDLAAKLEQLEYENRRNRSSLQAQAFMNQELLDENQRLKVSEQRLEVALAEQKSLLDASVKNLASVQRQIKESAETAGEARLESQGLLPWYQGVFYWFVLFGVGGVGLLAGAAAMAYLRRDEPQSVPEAGEMGASVHGEEDVVYSAEDSDESSPSN